MMNNHKLTKEQKTLVEKHYLLAMKIANRYFDRNENMLFNKKLDRDDISQIASILVCDCAKRHNSEKSEFSTYLINYLQLLIGREVDRYNSIKIPQRYTWNRNEGTSEDDKQAYMSIMYGSLANLDAPIKDESSEGINLSDTISSGDELESDEVLISKFIEDNLNEINANVFKLKMQNYMQSEIAEILGITVDSVKSRFHRSRKLLKEILRNGVDMV